MRGRELGSAVPQGGQRTDGGRTGAHRRGHPWAEQGLFGRKAGVWLLACRAGLRGSSSTPLWKGNWRATVGRFVPWSRVGGSHRSLLSIFVVRTTPSSSASRLCYPLGQPSSEHLPLLQWPPNFSKGLWKHRPLGSSPGISHSLSAVGQEFAFLQVFR